MIQNYNSLNNNIFNENSPLLFSIQEMQMTCNEHKRYMKFL